ncbi:hypothetical protein [Acidovorax temperans]|uniref:hypothetical protein n=2 Tax=Acidovorax TaxID=12916 RepID=UPI000829FA48|nr:hypothetical protein [Acidovorax temperans]MBO0941715.1 hypothetical protein [Acidovorax temperans]WCT25187.1 hypothetical protein PQV96_03855 [Acidovorax temperans]
MVSSFLRAPVAAAVLLLAGGLGALAPTLVHAAGRTPGVLSVQDDAPAARPSTPASVAATTAAVAAAPALNLRVSYFTRSIGNDGVQRDTRHTNRLVRQPGTVWTERELPAALSESVTHGHAHSHGPHAGHAHDEAQGAPLRVSRAADGTERVEVILSETRRVIEVDRAHHGNVGYGGSWDASYWIVPPATLQGMQTVGAPKAGVQRYRRVQGERTTTVDWDVAGQYPRTIERRDAHGTDITRVTVERLPLPAVMPWKASEAFGRGDYSDLLD